MTASHFHRLPLVLLGCLLFVAGGLAMPGTAKANINCAPTYNTMDFGSGNTGVATLDYNCTNYDTVSVSFTICAMIGSPSWPGSTSQPTMIGSTGTNLNFNLYTNAAHTTVWVGSTLVTKAVTIAAGGTVSGSLTVYGLIASGQSPPAASYSGDFYNTVIGILNGGTCQPSSSSPAFSGGSNSLHIAATVSNGCTVSAGNIALGTVAFTATNVGGSNTISVNCPSGTAYYIGLAPSSGNSAGSGTLTGTGGNTNHPAYQLRSGSTSGPAWGNTATSTTVGNGVAGTGTGSTQSITAYATVGSANYQPDTYSDTVTVTVNY